MGPKSVHSLGEAWALAGRQHGVVSRRQLLAIGLDSDAITHRLQRGRLHRTQWRGVYAVGRPQLSSHGLWMAAVLGCGTGATLSHDSAAALWGIRADRQRPIDVSVPSGRFPRRTGIVIHRRALRPNEVTARSRIPVTTPVRTLIDLAGRLDREELEQAVNGADKLDLVNPDALRAALERVTGQRGVGGLRNLLDRPTFSVTDSRLEQRFLAIARRAGLPTPLTQSWVNGFRVDFWWPDLRLVVETDGLRYHRTAAEQTADRRRDQAHTAAGLTALRFSHAQVTFDAEQVQGTLAQVAGRLKAQR
jgi:very-short-patch-repair endonuclease